jgi:hypothetical protein
VAAVLPAGAPGTEVSAEALLAPPPPPYRALADAPAGGWRALGVTSMAASGLFLERVFYEGDARDEPVQSPIVIARA